MDMHDAPNGLRRLVDPAVRPSLSEDAWLDDLPAGTVIPAAALARFRWPVDPYDNGSWLFVSCTTRFGDEEFRRWVLQLPEEGVLIDPSDERLQHLLRNARKTATL